MPSSVHELQGRGSSVVIAHSPTYGFRLICQRPCATTEDPDPSSNTSVRTWEQDCKIETVLIFKIDKNQSVNR
jgi:hypothetical protein